MVGGTDIYFPIPTKTVVKTTTTMAEMQVEIQAFRLTITCHWNHTKISPATGKAAKTHAMEKPIVVEYDPLMETTAAAPWHNKYSEKVVIRMTTMLSSFRRTESGNHDTRLSMLT